MTFGDLWRPYAWPRKVTGVPNCVDLGIFEDISMAVAISLSGRARSKKGYIFNICLQTISTAALSCSDAGTLI